MQHQAFALAASDGRVSRLRQLRQEDWARGLKFDARARGPFKGRVPLFSERLSTAHEELLGSQLALTLRLLKQYGGADIKAAQADINERRIDTVTLDRMERTAAILTGITGRRVGVNPIRQDADPASYFRLMSVIQAIRASVGASAEGAADGLRFIGEEVDEDATEATDKQLSRLFTIPIATAAGSQAAVDGFVAQNIGLIKSLTGTALDEVEQMVVQAMSGGTPTLRLAEAIEERFGVAWSRASLIARDQTAKLASQIAESRQLDYGITKAQWSTSGDARVRQKHAAFDGRIYLLATGIDGIKPGEEFQCLSGNTPIGFAHRVTKAYRRWYSGHTTEIVMASGEVIRLTPNHPVLTDHGWKPAHLVDVGDHVVGARQESGHLPELDVEHREPSIEEVFDALALVGNLRRVAGGAPQFHDDGTHEEVDVVDIDWSLPPELDAALNQKDCELFLAEADALALGIGELEQVFARLWGASASSIRGFCKALALLGGSGRHPGEHALTAVAWLDSLSTKLIAEGLSVGAVLLCKSLHALASQEAPSHLIGRVLLGVVGRAMGPRVDVPPSAELLGKVAAVAALDPGDLRERCPAIQKFDRVVHVGVSEEAGSSHVFNLETGCGWYTAAGLVVHNCRCTASPVLDDEDEAMLRAQAVARQQSELLQMQASPTVQGKIPNQSKFSDWNAARIAKIKAGDPTSVGLPAAP